VQSTKQSPLAKLVFDYFTPNILSERRAFKRELRRAEAKDGNGDDKRPICGRIRPSPTADGTDDSDTEFDVFECENYVAPGHKTCYSCATRDQRWKSFISVRISEGRSIQRFKRKIKPQAAAAQPPVVPPPPSQQSVEDSLRAFVHKQVALRQQRASASASASAMDTSD